MDSDEELLTKREYRRNKSSSRSDHVHMTSIRKRREKFHFTLGLICGLGVSCVVLFSLFARNPVLIVDSLLDKIQSSTASETSLSRPTNEDISSVLKNPSLTGKTVKLVDENSELEIQWFESKTVIEKTNLIKHSLQDGHLSSSSKGKGGDPTTCTASEPNRFDCWPLVKGATEQLCQARGCCWNPNPSTQGVPFCFYPDGYVGYSVVQMSSLISTPDITAKLARQTASPYPNDVLQLQLDVYFETEERVHFKIFDPANHRFEVPLNLSKSAFLPKDTAYNVTLQTSPFGILVTRKSNGAVLFDSRNMAPLVFADQFIQIGTRLSSANIYGLGEHRHSLRLDINWDKLVLWTRDEAPGGGGNLYGAHPFNLNLESDGQAHGVFLLNSNAMEISLQPYDDGNGALTYRTTGGVLDFYVFAGPTALNVVEQYVSLVGKPTMPPFWALGFHLCKYGYMNSTELRKVIQRNRAANIPYDVQWSDIDYMRDHLDWTYDSTTYYPDLPSIVDDLHNNDQRYIMIIDPGISNTQPSGSYPPYDQGVQMDIFVKNASGQILIGLVWPGKVAFPDFFHPNVEQYWFNQMQSYHNKIPFDGIWIDMNEPSNFVDGSMDRCTDGPLDNPPFTPPTIVGGSLAARTVCPSALQAISSHYNLHNMYGWSETKVTATCLWKLLGKRSLVISRSSFAGSGFYGNHWLGDNRSLWPDLYYSVPGILNFNMYGVAMAGADVCGFGGDTTRELCIRWMQLGSFYPFMRNHADLFAAPQDPASFDSIAVSYMRTALQTRYSLLPYMYTRFFLSHTTGTSVIRPLFALFPNTETIDKQFMWGEELLISPVLDEGATTVNAYIPEGIWYDLYNGTRLQAPAGQYSQLSAPLSTINVHIRGGSIVPFFPPAITTNAARQQPFRLLVALDENSRAQGLLYWDDGESLDTVENNRYSLVNFSLSESSVSSQILVSNYPGVAMDMVKVLGISNQPLSVTVNGEKVPFSFDIKVLIVNNLNVNLLSPFSISWS